MNRTGLLILFAAVVALAIGAYWFMTPPSERMNSAAPKSETLSTTDTAPPADEQTAQAPPADSAAPIAPPEQPAPAEPQLPDATTAPSDQLGGVQANDDERKLRARREGEDKQAKEDDADRVQGFNQASPPPPPPPPPPPAPVESTPPAMAPTPAPAPVVPPPTRTARGRAAPAPEDIPLFPWPVPKASATFEVPRQLIIGNTSAPTFGSVAERIASALDHAGYGERSYYALASGHGIAIATQLEQINDDGTPMIGVARFEDRLVAPSREQFSLTSYVKALFSARSGRFRIIVFTLSGGIAEGAKAPSEDHARSWAASGQTRLPQHYALIPFTDQVTCTALIYEFEKKDYADAAAFVPAGKLNAMSHLMKAGIWTLLGKP